MPQQFVCVPSVIRLEVVRSSLCAFRVVRLRVALRARFFHFVRVARQRLCNSRPNWLEKRACTEKFEFIAIARSTPNAPRNMIQAWPKSNESEQSGDNPLLDLYCFKASIQFNSIQSYNRLKRLSLTTEQESARHHASPSLRCRACDRHAVLCHVRVTNGAER